MHAYQYRRVYRIVLAHFNTPVEANSPHYHSVSWSQSNYSEGSKPPSEFKESLKKAYRKTMNGSSFLQTGPEVRLAALTAFAKEVFERTSLRVNQPKFQPGSYSARSIEERIPSFLMNGLMNEVTNSMLLDIPNPS